MSILLTYFYFNYLQLGNLFSKFIFLKLIIDTDVRKIEDLSEILIIYVIYSFVKHY